MSLRIRSHTYRHAYTRLACKVSLKPLQLMIISANRPTFRAGGVSDPKRLECLPESSSDVSVCARRCRTFRRRWGCFGIRPRRSGRMRGRHWRKPHGRLMRINGSER